MSVFKKFNPRLTLLILITITLSICICLVKFTYDYKQKIEKQNNLSTELAEKIRNELSLSLDYMSDIFRFIGDQVNINGEDNLKYISSILSGNLIDNEKARAIFSWAMLDWSSPDNKMKVSTRFGILPNQIDISYRNYAIQAHNAPGIMHFDLPDVGITSHKWVIPAGMGISNKKGKLSGIISTGIRIESLKAKLELISNNIKNSSFVLVYEDGTPIFSSGVDILEKDLLNTQFSVRHLKDNGNLTSPVYLGTSILTNYTKLDGYPFLVITGYHRSSLINDFYVDKTGEVIVIILLTMILVVILLVNYSLFESKFMSAVKYVLEKSNKNKWEKIPKIYSSKISKEILGIIIKERREKLKNINFYANQIKSWKERESFHGSVNSKLREVLDKFEISVGMFSSSNIDQMSDTTLEYLEFSMKAYLCQLKTYVVPETKKDIINIRKIIANAVIISRIKASLEGVKLISNMKDEFPEFIGDEVKLMQAFIGIIAHSIECTPSDGKVTIEASIDKHSDGEAAFLVFSVSDDGIGIDEKERFIKWKDINTLKNIHDTRNTTDQISFTMISEIAKSHSGTFSTVFRFSKGSTFVMRLPFPSDLERIPLDITPETNKKKRGKRNAASTSGGQILPFSKK